MKKEKKRNKINRIAKCLSELLNDSLSIKSKDNLTIPLEVWQNLVYDETIDTGSKLRHECFASQKPEYKVLQPYPAGALSRDYVKPVIELITSYSQRFPFTSEAIYDTKNHNKLLGYNFTINRELYLAQRIDAIMRYHQHNGYRKFTVSHRKFIKLLKSSRLNLRKDFEEQKYDDWQNPFLSAEERDAFTYTHVIPTLNRLNEIAIQASYNFRYDLLISCNTGERNKHQVTYHFKTVSLNAVNDCHALYDNTNSTYFSLKNTQPITYYKMSKWAYLIHVYLMHLFQTCRQICLDEANNGQEIRYYIEELKAEMVWDFWYNSPIHSNSYISVFEKAIEELRNNCISVIRTGDFEQIKVFILPDTTVNDNKYGILRKYNQSYSNPNSQSDDRTIYSDYDHLYQITPGTSGTYYVSIKKEYVNYLLNENHLSEYPKEFTRISSKTSYSQMRLYEALYDTLPYDSVVKDKNKLSVPKLAFKTGKLDLADWKINRHMSIVDPTTNTFNKKIYNRRIKTKGFAYDFYRFFILPSIETLNAHLRKSNIELGYLAEFCEDTKNNSPFPDIHFSLVPIEHSLLTKDN